MKDEAKKTKQPEGLRVRAFATLDENTCLECRQKSGRVVPWGYDPADHCLREDRCCRCILRADDPGSLLGERVGNRDIWRAKYFETREALRAANRGIARLSHKKQKAQDIDWLDRYTDFSAGSWVMTIESLIRKHSVADANGETSSTKIYSVISELVDYGFSVLRKRPDYDKTDGNISMLSLLAVVLAMWVKSVINAKAMDANRAIEDRKAIFKFLPRWTRDFSAMLVHQPPMREPWKDQTWENPFDATAEQTKKL